MLPRSRDYLIRYWLSFERCYESIFLRCVHVIDDIVVYENKDP